MFSFQIGEDFVWYNVAWWSEKKRIHAFENKCLRKLLNIKYYEHKTNQYVLDTIKQLVGNQEPLLTTVKRRKLAWFGHVCRHNTLSKTIMQGTTPGSRKRGRPRKSWSDNVKEWTDMKTSELLLATGDRERWRRLAASKASSSPPTTKQSWGESEIVKYIYVN